MNDAKEVVGEQDLGAINIFLFSNGQQYSPPRKYYLKAEELAWWDTTLGFLARSQYTPEHTTIDLYTIDGNKIESPADLRNYAVYVAVVPPEPFVQAGYDKYLLKASRSWEKRKSKRTVSSEPTNPDDVNNRERTKPADSTKGSSNDQTLDENIPLDIVMSNVTEERPPRIPHVNEGKSSSQKRKPNVIQVSQRPNVPRKVRTPPPVELSARQASLSKRDTPRNNVRLNKQSLPNRTSTDKTSTEKTTEEAKRLSKHVVPSISVPHRVNDRNPLYRLKSPVKTSMAKADQASNKKRFSSPDKRENITTNKNEDDIPSLLPLPFREEALIEKPQDSKQVTKLPSPTKTADTIETVSSLTKILEELLDDSSKINKPLSDDVVPTKIERDIKSPDLEVKTSTSYNNDSIANKIQSNCKIVPLITIQSYNKSDYSSIEEKVNNQDSSKTQPNLKILNNRTKDTFRYIKPPGVSPIDSRSTLISGEPKNVIRSLEYSPVDKQEENSVLTNISKPNAIYPISKCMDNWLQLFMSSELATPMLKGNGVSDNLQEHDVDFSSSNAKSANTNTATLIKKENDIIDDELAVPLIVLQSTRQSTNDTQIRPQPETNTTPIVVMVDKGDTVNLKVNIEIISAAGILKTSKTFETRKSRSLKNLSADVTNDDRVLTHSKSLQSVENECTSSQASGHRNEKMKVYQCACCDRCANDTNYKLDTMALRHTEQPCYILLPILTRPKRESCICPNNRTSEKEVQNSLSVVTKCPKDDKNKTDVSTSTQNITISCQTDKDDIYTESLKYQACHICRAGGESMHSEIIIVRAEASQTSNFNPNCDCGSKHLFRDCKDSQNKFTQTNWCDVMLEARIQPDGHYTFHLPSLQVLRDYNLWEK